MKKIFFLFIVALLIIPSIQSSENKEFQKEYESQILNALEKYPELKNDSIKFIEKNLHKRTGYSKLKLNFIFLAKENHKYNIYINNKYSRTSMVMGNFSTKGQIGLIGHELGHIIDYKEKNDLQIILTGIKYLLSKEYREKLENNIDKITINHNLGNELYETTKMMYNNKEYWKDKKGIYYTPEEILNLTKEFEKQK